MKHNITTGIVIIVACAAALLPLRVFAAVVSFEPAALTSPQAQSYTLTIMLDTEGESINAVEGSVVVDTSLGDLTSTTDSGSLVTYWVKRPEWQQSTRSVSFSGAIPGGYNGKGILLSIVMPSFAGSGPAAPFKVVNFKAFRNDGFGSAAQVTVQNFSFSTASSMPDSAITDQLFTDANKKDNIPPEIFSPNISRDDRVYGGKWFAVFATQDKQSGIDHYEIQESRSGKIDAGKWKRVESPYLLQDQALYSFVYIIAIDRQGNERVIKIFPRNSLAWFQQWGQILIVFSAIIIVLLFVTFLKRRHHNKSLRNLK